MDARVGAAGITDAVLGLQAVASPGAVSLDVVRLAGSVVGTGSTVEAGSVVGAVSTVGADSMAVVAPRVVAFTAAAGVDKPGLWRSESTESGPAAGRLPARSRFL
jgi:hypothetical protein